MNQERFNQLALALRSELPNKSWRTSMVFTARTIAPYLIDENRASLRRWLGATRHETDWLTQEFRTLGQIRHAAAVGFIFNSLNELDANGFGLDGFNLRGWTEDGFNREGRNALGFDRAGWGRDGFDVNGLDIDGEPKNVHS